MTTTSIVPTPQQRTGDFSGQAPLINYFTGQPVPDNKIPASMQSPVALNALSLYPLGNLSPSLYTSTQIRTQNSDQGGFRLDHNFSSNDQLTARFAMLNGNAVSPFSTAGSNVPGFPVADSITTYSATVAETHTYSPRVIQTVRAAFFRNQFLFDQRLNLTPPSALGFQYQPTLGESAGPPFLIVSGYASVGDPITGPRNTYQNNYAVSYSLSATMGRHSLKFGGEYSRNQINLLYGIATNGFFVFAPFPFSDSFASFLTGQSVLFFQGGGQFDRGLRNNLTAGYAQDEWRITPRLTLTVGLRYEVNTPFTDIRNRLNAWAPGQQSIIYPTAPKGLLFPGDAGVPDGIAPGLLQRRDAAHRDWPGIPRERAHLHSRRLRHLLRPVHQRRRRSSAGAGQCASLDPGVPARRSRIQHRRPLQGGAPPFGTNVFVQPATVLTVEQGMRPPYAQDWNFSIQQVLGRELPPGCPLRRQQGDSPPPLPRRQSGRLRPGRHGGKRGSAPHLRRLSERSAGALQLRLRRPDQQSDKLDLSRSSGRILPPLLERPGLPGLVLVFEEPRLRLVIQRLGFRRRETSPARTIWPRIPSTWPRNMVRHCSTRASASPSAAAMSCRSGRMGQRPPSSCSMAGSSTAS